MGYYLFFLHFFFFCFTGLTVSGEVTSAIAGCWCQYCADTWHWWLRGLNCNFAVMARQRSWMNRSYAGSKRVAGSDLVSWNHFSSALMCGWGTTVMPTSLHTFPRWELSNLRASLPAFWSLNPSYHNIGGTRDTNKPSLIFGWGEIFAHMAIMSVTKSSLWALSWALEQCPMSLMPQWLWSPEVGGHKC